jgi:hypothetical protein
LVDALTVPFSIRINFSTGRHLGGRRLFPGNVRSAKAEAFLASPEGADRVATAEILTLVWHAVGGMMAIKCVA